MREVWEHRTEDSPHEEWCLGAEAGGTVVLASRPDAEYATLRTLTAVDLASGELRWRRTCRPLHHHAALVADGDLLVTLHLSGSEMHVRGYDVATGEERWAHAVPGEPRAAVMRGSEIVVAAGSSVLKLDRDGRLGTKVTMRGTRPEGLALTDDGDLIVQNGNGKGNLLRLDGETLETTWAVRVPGMNWASPSRRS